MSTYTLQIKLLSDTTFGRGDGVAGGVDAEVQHDSLGLPSISGRSLKGLLVNAAADILYSLNQVEAGTWHAVAERLFGVSGQTQNPSDLLIIGNATFAPDLVEHLRHEKSLSREDILNSVTAIRRQTAIDAESGAPRDESLRSMRVVVREQTFYAPLQFTRDPSNDEKAFLAACVLSLRRMGTGRTRGRGHVSVCISDAPQDAEKFAAAQIQDLTSIWFVPFKHEVTA